MSEFFNKNKNYNKYYDKAVNKHNNVVENNKDEEVAKNDIPEVVYNNTVFTKEVTPVVEEVMNEKPEVVEEVKEEVPEVRDTYEITEWKYGTIVGCNKLNFRKEPTKNSDIIGEFQYDTTIRFAELDGNFEWFKVQDPKTNKVGYCMSEYIKPEI